MAAFDSLLVAQQSREDVEQGSVAEKAPIMRFDNADTLCRDGAERVMRRRQAGKFGA